jgi:uncharacterized membrane protein
MSGAFDTYRASACVTTVVLSLMAGFFYAFAIDVAPAMTHLDATSYVRTQQWINGVVRNVPFATAYFGSAVLPFVPAILAARRLRRGPALAWAVVGLVYLGAVFWVTRSINVPINEALAQWNPLAPPADWAAARDRWNDANMWRAVAAAGCFAAAVVLTAMRGSEVKGALILQNAEAFEESCCR